MKRFIAPIIFSTLLFSCTPDGQKMSQEALDSIAALNQTNGPDTFSVQKKDTSTAAQKKQQALDSAEANQIVSDASTLIHQGDPDQTTTIQNANGVVSNPDVPPSFPGGEAALENYIARHQEYPLVAFQNEIKGTVKLKFVIEADGTIGGISVIQSVGYGCDESAVDLVSRMPKWIPGKKSGANVRCAVILPLTFGQ
jgi:protein TonB